MDNKDKKIETFGFHYQKNPDFKTVYTSGVVGGINVQGLINMNFFVDRPPIPQKVTYDVVEQENKPVIGQQTNIDVKDGAIREVQVGLLLDIHTAQSIINWLEQKIKEIKSVEGENK